MSKFETSPSNPESQVIARWLEVSQQIGQIVLAHPTKSNLGRISQFHRGFELDKSPDGRGTFASLVYVSGGEGSDLVGGQVEMQLNQFQKINGVSQRVEVSSVHTIFGKNNWEVNPDANNWVALNEYDSDELKSIGLQPVDTESGLAWAFAQGEYYQPPTERDIAAISALSEYALQQARAEVR